MGLLALGYGLSEQLLPLQEISDRQQPIATNSTNCTKHVLLAHSQQPIALVPLRLCVKFLPSAFSMFYALCSMLYALCSMLYSPRPIRPTSQCGTMRPRRRGNPMQLLQLTAKTSPEAAQAAADFWLWAGIRLTAGGFMAGFPAN